jgi:hypothetical protein
MKPDEKDPFVERLVGGLGPPQPPPELRSRVLAAARGQAPAEPEAEVWSKLWNHRGLRLAWAATVFVLLAGHVLIMLGNGASLGPVEPTLVAENRVDEQFVDMLRPSRISDNVQPIVGLFASTGGQTDLDLEGNPS